MESFSNAIQYLLKRGITKNKIIVWSNSIRVHKLSSKFGLIYRSKKEMSDAHYMEKGINPNYKSKMADEQKISELLISLDNHQLSA